MSDEDQEKLRNRMGVTSTEELLAFNQKIVEEFRANEGKCGGPFEGNPMVLITMTGAKSDRTLTNPLTYHADGDDCIIMASAGGSPTHPAWYHNLVAHPDITVERGAEKYAATAVLIEGDERAAAFKGMTEAIPRFADYQAGVEREIPIFRLVRKA